MVKLNYYAYTTHFSNHEFWFTVSFISEHQWINFWNDARTGSFICMLGKYDKVFHYVTGTCPELDNTFLTSTGFPKTIKFKTEFEGLVDRN